MQMNQTTVTTAEAQPQRSAPDWDRIRQEFEDGNLSIREIGRQHRLSDTAVRKRAIAAGWDTSSRAPEAPANQPEMAVQTAPQSSAANQDAAPEVRAGNHCGRGEASDEDEEQFDWSRENPCILVPSQDAVAVYHNPYGDVVIRREEAIDEEECFIVIGQRDVPALIERLRELIS
jgi:hypothetical protein